MAIIPAQRLCDLHFLELHRHADRRRDQPWRPAPSVETFLPGLLLLSLLISAASALGCVIASLLLVVLGLYPPEEFPAVVSGNMKMAMLIGLIFGLSSFFMNG